MDVVGRRHNYHRGHRVDWHYVPNLLEVDLQLPDDPQPNEEEEGGCCCQTVDPAGEGLRIASIYDGGPDQAQGQILLPGHHKSFAEVFGVGVGVGEFPQELLGVSDEFGGAEGLQLLELFLGGQFCVRGKVHLS